MLEVLHESESECSPAKKLKCSDLEEWLDDSSIRRLDTGVNCVHFLGALSRSKFNARAMRGKRVWAASGRRVWGPPAGSA